MNSTLKNTGNYENSEHKPDANQASAEALSQMWEIVRMRRDFLLLKSDWTQVDDNPLEARKRTEWRLYRQDLRDVTDHNNHITELKDVIFPEPPT